MQVNIEIQGDEFAGTLEELIKKLDEDQVKDLTLQVVKNFLGIDPEYTLFKAKLADETAARAARNSSRYGPESGLDREAQRKLEDFKSSRQELIEVITQTAMRHFKRNVTRMVREDKFLKEVFVGVRNEIVKEFPSMVQTAVISWFVHGMDGIKQEILQRFGMDALEHRITDLVTNLQNRFLSDGQPILPGSGGD